MNKKWHYFLVLFVSLFMSVPLAVSVYADESAQSVVQTKKITVTVVDTKGEPIIGANVLVKGTNKGGITNQKGKFTLNVPN